MSPNPGLRTSIYGSQYAKYLPIKHACCPCIITFGRGVASAELDQAYFPGAKADLRLVQMK